MSSTEQCAAICNELEDCNQFSYGPGLGCRVSHCGPAPANGGEVCPANLQCPVVPANNDYPDEVLYKRAPGPRPLPAVPEGFRDLGNGDCDWHYTSHGNIGV